MLIFQGEIILAKLLQFPNSIEKRCINSTIFTFFCLRSFKKKTQNPQNHPKNKNKNFSPNRYTDSIKTV